jgi:hypothetical protein
MMHHYLLFRIVKMSTIPVLVFFLACAPQEGNHSNEQIPDVSEVSVNLPEGYGKELVEANCVPCHSLRYIEMQPHMTRKSWEKIVSKMIKNFGAPIKDTLIANQIVNYLVQVKGVKELKMKNEE